MLQCSFCFVRAQAKCPVCFRGTCYLPSRSQHGHGIVCYECYRPTLGRGLGDNSVCESTTAEELETREDDSVHTLGMQRDQCPQRCGAEVDEIWGPAGSESCGRQCCLRPNHSGAHRCYQCWLEALNARRQTAPSASSGAVRQEGKFFAQVIEARVEARRRARATLE